MNHTDTTRKNPSLLLHDAAGYDLRVWLLTFGRERTLRRKILRPARLQAGESVLDVGCGTGSLAIEARRQVGAAGAVQGIDASEEMIARATLKARRARLDIGFRVAPAQSLPFADGQFDVVLGTLMLHHLPGTSRHRFLLEMRRVLRPGGRALLVDFGQPSRASIGRIARWHRHGHVAPDDMRTLLAEADLTLIGHGATGMAGLQFVLGQRSERA